MTPEQLARDVVKARQRIMLLAFGMSIAFGFIVGLAVGAWLWQ